MVRKADRAKIRYFRGKDEGVAEVFDSTWLEKIAVVLDGASPQPTGICFCISYPIIELYQGDQKLASISVHHEDRLRFIGEGFGGDFVVGKKVGAEISRLAEMKKGLIRPPKPVMPPIEIPKPEITPNRANKSLQPTPTAVMPPAAQEIMPAVCVAEH
jgi:hypothetical protein